MGFIYVIVNAVNDKVYIGKTVTSLASRWKAHAWQAHHGSSGHLSCAIRKHGSEAFGIHELRRSADSVELDMLEIMLIALFESNNRAHGYNMTDGGDGWMVGRASPLRGKKSGRKPTNPFLKGHIPWNKDLKHKPESIVKMKAAQRQLRNAPGYVNPCLNRKATAEHRHKLRISHLGNTSGRGNKGRQHSEATKNKMQSAHAGKRYALGVVHDEAFREQCRNRAIAQWQPGGSLYTRRHNAS